MMRISVIVNTVRLGGLDVLFNSLLCQQGFSFGDFELILVDGWYAERKQFLDQLTFPFQFCHLPPREEHDYYDDNTGWNTGLEVVIGELVIFQADYTWVSSTLLADHWRAYEELNHHASMTGYLCRMPYPKLHKGNQAEGGIQFDLLKVWGTMFEREMVSSVAKSFLESVEPLYIEDKGGVKGEPIGRFWELPGEKFYAGLNESIPLGLLRELNGWDERYNGGYGSNDIDIGVRANMLGWKFVVNPESINYKFGMPGAAAGRIPAKEKERLRSPEDNAKMFEERRHKIDIGEESVRVPAEFGCWG